MKCTAVLGGGWRGACESLVRKIITTTSGQTAHCTAVFSLLTQCICILFVFSLLFLQKLYDSNIVLCLYLKFSFFVTLALPEAYQALNRFEIIRLFLFLGLVFGLPSSLCLYCGQHLWHQPHLLKSLCNSVRACALTVHTHII